MSHGRSLTNGYVSERHGRCGGAAGEEGESGERTRGAVRKSRTRRDMSCAGESWGARGWETHGARNNGVMRTRSAEEELNNSGNWSAVRGAVQHSERSSLVD